MHDGGHWKLRLGASSSVHWRKNDFKMQKSTRLQAANQVRLETKNKQLEAEEATRNCEDGHRTKASKQADFRKDSREEARGNVG